ncbi:hypothetical protein E2C01_018532 [Portunus trituberculatus]|uniref:Uncharacterized protein n=1 Tax=Portunus trituberculatus TaxID=210409 RepID=A0A5B7DUP6_PORTR|nr:hypothetical protein [Portunus trituberculatus]
MRCKILHCHFARRPAPPLPHSILHPAEEQTTRDSSGDKATSLHALLSPIDSLRYARDYNDSSRVHRSQPGVWRQSTDCLPCPFGSTARACRRDHPPRPAHDANRVKARLNARANDDITSTSTPNNNKPPDKNVDSPAPGDARRRVSSVRTGSRKHSG